MTTLARFKYLGALLSLWLLGIGLALAQAGNSIEAFDVAARRQRRHPDYHQGAAKVRAAQLHGRKPGAHRI